MLSKFKENLTVIVLCGGKGKRLLPITKSVPKPLLKINKKEILHYILEHLKKGSQFDPITREPLRPDQLVPNVNLRIAAHTWLSNHAWAFGDIVRPNAPLE